MTYQEFLQALEKTPRDWRLIHGAGGSPFLPLIRRFSDEGSQCPISALDNKISSTVHDVANAKGIDRIERSTIIKAADGYGESETRTDLLRACGLSESA